MSSLSYHTEHLAWQQRIKQEKSQATNFFKSTGKFPSYDLANVNNRPMFPKATIDENPINYRSLKYNIGYTFGGTTNIKNSWLNLNKTRSYSKSPTKLPQIAPESSKRARSLRQLGQELLIMKKKCGYGKILDGNLTYIRELEEKLISERKKRLKSEWKLGN